MSSWIDDALDAAAVRRLFSGVLAARDDLERHAALPPPGPDSAVATYWRPRPPRSGDSAQPLFDTTPADAAADRLGDALRALWSQTSPENPDGLPELVALVPQFASLATRLRDGPAAGDPTARQRAGSTPVEAVPALIYPMF